MKLFHGPGTCSIGIRVILEEIGLDYDLVTINVAEGDQHKPEFREINPKGKVPALVRDDGTVLTEFPAIAFWLAKSHPEAGLLPDDFETEIRILELIDHICGTLHVRGTTLAMIPGKFVQGDDAQQQIAAHGREVANAGLERLAAMLGDKPYFFGEFSIADAAVFFLLQWRDRAKLTVPETLDAFHQRMLARPAVARALQ